MRASPVDEFEPGGRAVGIEGEGFDQAIGSHEDETRPVHEADGSWLRATRGASRNRARQQVLFSAPLKRFGMEGRMRSTVKFSEDVVPIGDLKVNPGKVVRRASESGRPILLTSHGRGVAVVQTLPEFEAAQEEREFMRAVLAGLFDLEEGRELSLEDARRRLGFD